jgi:hypothetical protein
VVGDQLQFSDKTNRWWKKMKFEKPQKGNPHGLTINQHVFPRASIERFYDSNGFVSVFYKDHAKVIPSKSSNELFCAKRVRDQKTESGIGKQIEDKFQSLVDSVLSGAVRIIGHFEKDVIEQFFSLWRARHKFKIEGLPDIQSEGISGELLTQDQQEILEKNHTIFMRQGGIMPGRFAASIHVVGYLQAFRSSNLEINWGIVRSESGEFIVPDCFEDMMIVPISPNITLIADQPDSVITRAEVAVINRIAVQRSTNFYFARKLSACPLYDITPPRIHRRFAI